MVGAQVLAESRTMTESPVDAGLSSFREQSANSTAVPCGRCWDLPIDDDSQMI
jgi:hypothetical protein